MKRRDAVHLGCVVHVPCPGPYNSTYGRDESVPLFHFRTFMILWKGSFHVRRVLVETAPTCCTRALSTWRGSGGPVGYSSPRRGSRYDRRSWTFVSSWFFFYSLSFWFVKKTHRASQAFVFCVVPLTAGLRHRITGDLSRWVVSTWRLWVVSCSLFICLMWDSWLSTCQSEHLWDAFGRCDGHPCVQTPSESAFNCFPFFSVLWMNDTQRRPRRGSVLLSASLLCQNGSVCWLPPYLIYTRHQLLFMTRFIHNLSPVWTRIRFLKFL